MEDSLYARLTALAQRRGVQTTRETDRAVRHWLNQAEMEEQERVLAPVLSDLLAEEFRRQNQRLGDLLAATAIDAAAALYLLLALVADATGEEEKELYQAARERAYRHLKSHNKADPVPARSP